MLTLKPTELPLAVVKGGTLDGKIIYYSKETDTKSDMPIDRRKMKEELLIRTDESYTSLMNKMFSKKKNLSNDPMYKKAKAMSFGDELSLKDPESIMIPIPNPLRRDIIYVTGPSGSGKSYWCRMYAKMFLSTQDEEGYIRLFSKVIDDPSLEGLPISTIMLDDEYLNTPLPLSSLDNSEDGTIPEEEIEPSLFMYDDIDTVSKKKIRDKIKGERDDVLQIGRHNNIYALITSHNITKGLETKTILNECTSLVVFPNTNNQQIKYALGKYADLSDSDIKKIIDLGSRWVMVNRVMPRYVLHEHGVYLLH